MSINEKIFSGLKRSGLKGADSQGFPKGNVPPLPWFTYSVNPVNTFYADDTLYYGEYDVTVDLREKERDSKLETDFWAICNALGTTEEPLCTWLKTENVWVITYSFIYDPNRKENDNG